MKNKHRTKLLALAVHAKWEAEWFEGTTKLEEADEYFLADLCADYKDLVSAVEALGLYLIKLGVKELSR